NSPNDNINPKLACIYKDLSASRELVGPPLNSRSQVGSVLFTPAAASRGTIVHICTLDNYETVPIPKPVSCFCSFQLLGAHVTFLIYLSCFLRDGGDKGQSYSGASEPVSSKAGCW
ncbi:unnamed protein product, partial [Linum tenue]